jgi:LacI family transcriptional regulator
MTDDIAPPPPPPADSEPERPTLKTIAAETGLAIATVSRALKDAPDIGEETKRRVRETAARLGYRPNRAGVRLRTGKTNVIALILSAEAGVMNHTSRLMTSIANALRGTAYHLVIMPFFPDQDPMDPVRYVVETGSADGLILNQTRPEDPRIRYLVERGFPFATHGRTDMGLDHPYFDFDNEAFARLGVERLVAAGRRRLFLIPPPRIHTYSREMTRGFAEASADFGASFEVMTGATSDSPAERVGAAVAARMARPPRPDGIVCGSTTATMAAVAAAEAAGMTLGRDFDVVGKEAIPVLRLFRTGIMVVPEDVGRAGDFLAHALVAEIEHRPTAARQGLEVPGPIPPRPQPTMEDKG